MAHSYSKSGGNSTSNVAVTGSSGDKVKAASTIFHDFLGKGSAPDPSTVVGPAAGKVRPLSEASASASVSLGASSGGGRGPVSTTSDLGSVERQVGNHLEGVPFYGPRSDFVAHDTSNRFSGTKRSSSDSYLRTSNDRFPSVRQESLDSSQLMKLLQHSGRERPKRPHDEDSSLSMHVIRPMPSALLSQTFSVGRTDAKSSRLDCNIPMNVGSAWQQPPRSSQVLPFGYPALSSKFRDSNAGPSVMSQGAADEGSRTGIKGPGILSSINESFGVSDKNFSRPKVSCDKQKSGIHLPELENSTTPSLKGITSSGCQMTIFYGGQAHVFDNVQPNKADIIMSLAGSNGGSWSTTYVPNSTSKKFTGESCTPSEKNISLADSSALRAEVLGKMSVRVNSTHELGSGTQEKLLKESRATFHIEDKREV